MFEPIPLVTCECSNLANDRVVTSIYNLSSREVSHDDMYVPPLLGRPLREIITRQNFFRFIDRLPDVIIYPKSRDYTQGPSIYSPHIDLPHAYGLPRFTQCAYVFYMLPRYLKTIIFSKLSRLSTYLIHSKKVFDTI